MKVYLLYTQAVFSRYDLDNSGSIEKDEMLNVMKSIYSMVDGNVSEANRGSTQEKVKKDVKFFVQYQLSSL